MASEIRVNTINSRTGFGTITVSETGQDLVGITTVENLTTENTLVGAAASFTGNVQIGGVLTYEDVTNIDSVGLITARNGIEIGARPGVAASISVDGNMIVSGISTFGGNLQINNDSGKLQLGASQDLQIYHDGSVNVIDSSLANLEIRHGAEKLAAFAQDGQAELYYDNTKRFETTSSGCKVSAGHLDLDDSQNIRLGNSQDFLIYHNGSNSIINDNGTGNLELVTNGTKITFQGGSDTMANFIKDGAVELYYDNIKKFETTSTGFKYHGNNGSIQMAVGASDQDDVYIKDGSVNWDSAYNGTNDGWISIYGYNGGTTQFRNTKIGNGKGTAILTCTGSSGVVSGDLSDTSDERLKKDIVSIGSEGLTKIKQLRPVSFKWKNTDRDSYGFIAQELETVLPHAVATAETDDDSWAKLQAAATETGTVVVRDTKSINTNSIVAYLTKAVQELSAKNDALETRIAALEAS